MPGLNTSIRATSRVATARRRPILLWTSPCSASTQAGGILRVRDLVYDFEASEADARMAAWFAVAVDDPARGWTAAELAEHVRTEHSTFTTSR